MVPLARADASAIMGAVRHGERGHRSLPHTADVILEAWGPDLASCCEEAVAALVEVYVDSGTARAADRVRVHMQPATPESLILDVLEEVIFTLDTADAVPVGATVSADTDGSLDVDVLLADRAVVTPTGAGPKAVSRAIELDSRPGAVRCRFIVDV